MTPRYPYMATRVYAHGVVRAVVHGRSLTLHSFFTQAGSVSDDPAGVTYWKVSNGIRLTGMPSFKSALTDQQMWQVSALLAHDDKLPPEVQDALKPVAVAPSVSAPLGQPKVKQRRAIVAGSFA